jgi:hypothetical protein
MGYVSKNPKFDGVIFTESVIASAKNPAAGSRKLLIDSSGDVFVKNSGGTSVQIGGIGSINGLTTSTQTFAVGTAGTNFNISSAGSTHTFNIPDASASNRGVLTTGAQTIAGAKTFSGGLGTTSLDMGQAGSGTLAVARGGTGVTSSTGTGNNVLSASPTMTGVAAMAGLTLTTSGGTADTLDFYETQEDVSVASTGDITSGTFTFNITRIGNLVTISSVQTWTFNSSLSTPETGVVVPSQFRPDQTVYNLYSLVSNNSLRVAAQSNGVIAFAFFDGGGNANNRANTQTTFTISYIKS